jgi:DNA gyrase subunit A
VKKTALTQFARPRSVGLRAIELDEGDTLVGTAITNGSCDVILFSSSGKAARFQEAKIRPLSRTSRGVRGIRMAEGFKVVGMIIPLQGGQALTVSENGYGKRTSVDEFPAKGRGSQGVIGMQTSERNGPLIGAVQVFDGEEFMLISDQGTMVRTRVDEVSLVSRNTQGVRLIKLRDGEQMQGLQRIEESADENAKRELAHAEASADDEVIEDDDVIDDGDNAVDDSDEGSPE